MLLVDHLLGLAGVLGQFGEFVREFGLRCEQGCSGRCAVADVDLVVLERWNLAVGLIVPSLPFFLS